MAAFSRGLSPSYRRGEFTCTRCLQFSTTSTIQSGHNRWSKIKHDKGTADAKKNVLRSSFSKDIALISKLYGGDPNTNSKLATILATAKKAGYPKASIEAALARGQGKSSTGAILENLMLEVIMPPSVAMIIDAETDNRNRTLMELRLLVKNHGGTVTPTSYLFQKKGRLAFEADERNLGVDDVLDEAIEAGAEDVETDDNGNVVVWTEPTKISAAAQALEKSLKMKVESSDIIWDPNEDTMVPLEDKHAAMRLAECIEALQDNSDVQGVYANAARGTIADEIWEEIEGRLHG